MRLFVAIEVPEGVRRALAELIAKLRPAAPEARWVRAENIHVTLKFIGEVPPAQLEPIRKALAALCSGQGGDRAECAPVSMNFRGIGFFPNERWPRVFWAGMDASPNLVPLATALEAILEPLGIARESRPFSPHLTLARFHEPRPVPKLLEAVAPLHDVFFGDTATSEFHLFESRLKPGGAQYARLATFLFAAREGQGS
jgi:RNA 2',3'-cyclic 3'-phosphodiesterase